MSGNALAHLSCLYITIDMRGIKCTFLHRGSICLASAVLKTQMLKTILQHKKQREPAECAPTSLKHFTVHSYSDRAFLAPSDELGRSMDILGFCELRFAGSLDPTGAFSFSRTRSTESSSDSQQTRCIVSAYRNPLRCLCYHVCHTIIGVCHSQQ